MAVEAISSVASHNSVTSSASSPAPSASTVLPVSPVTAVGSSTAKKVVEQPEAETKGHPQGETSTKDETALNERLRKAVEKLNSELATTMCKYSFHDDTNRIMIRIVDKETEEVIREFPAEETLDMIYKAWEIAGILVDEKL